MHARTTKIVFETSDYFLAHLDNGGIRVGMFEVCSVDFPAGHADYAEAAALTPETIEAFCDNEVATGRFCIIA